MDKGDIKTDRALSFGEKNTVQSVQYKDELFFKINLSKTRLNHSILGNEKISFCNIIINYNFVSPHCVCSENSDFDVNN